MTFSQPKALDTAEAINRAVLKAVNKPGISKEEADFLRAAGMIEHMEEWFQANSFGFSYKQALKLATHRHYKGGLYRYIGPTKHSETGEAMTAYLHLFPYEVTVWVRPQALFFGLHNGRARFEGLSDELKEYYAHTTYIVVGKPIDGKPHYLNVDHGWYEGDEGMRKATRCYTQAEQHALEALIKERKLLGTRFQVVIPGVGIQDA